MNLDVTVSDNNTEYYFSGMPIVESINMKLIDLVNITGFVKGFESKDWLIEAIRLSKLEMKCEESKLIEEARSEIKKTRKIMKEQYPVRYFISYNPLTILIKCLLKLK